MASQVTRVNNQEEQGGRSFEAPGWAQRLLEYPRRVRAYLHEVRVELKQVTWPSWEDVRSTTGVVIATVFFFGAFLALVDFGVSRIVTRVLDYFKR